jgi:hypothetical protein
MAPIRDLLVLPSLEEGRKRFSGFSPLAERLKKEVRILSIGEFFGGTMAFNYRALLGAGQMLRKNDFDLIVINGGVLPEVPVRGSRTNRKKMEQLMEGIDNISDACEVMRKPVKQLIAAAGGKPIVYVMGEDDHENIEIIIDRKIAEARKAENIKARIEGMREQASDLDSRISSMEEENNSRVREMKKYGQFLQKADGKKKGKVEGRLEGRIRKMAKEVKEIARKREELIDRRAKLRERMVMLEDDLQNLGAVRRTNIEYLTPCETKELRKNATKEYMDILHRVFEGSEVHILQDNVSLFELGGFRVAIGHSMENTSKVAKRNGLVARQEAQAKLQIYGLLPQVDLYMFTHHPGTKGWAVPQTFASDHPLYVFQQGGFSDPKGLFDAHNRRIKTPHTEALDKHQLDSGITVITARKDGAVSFDMIGLSMLEEHARPLLEKEHRKLVRRLESMDMPKDGSVKQSSVPVDIPGIGTFEEFPQKEKEKVRKSPRKPVNGISPRLVMQSRLQLPSELSRSQLSAILGSPDLSRSPEEEADILIKVPERRKIAEIIAEVHSDYHIGVGNMWNDYSNQEIMRAAIADSREMGLPEIIVLAGDMVEGALGSKANEFVARSFVDENEFKRLLRHIVTERKLGELAYEKALAEYYKRSSYAYTVPNVDQQIHLLIPLIEHAAEVVAKGGEAIVISGNHYNQTHRSERIDEALRLASMLKMIGGFRDNDPRIHVFYGGWIGSGQVTVKGIPIFGIHAGRGSRDKVTGLMEHKVLQRRDSAFLVLEGHHHDMAFGKTLSDAHVAAPSPAPLIPYVDQAALHGGLRGYTRMKLYADERGKHFESIGVMNRYIPQLKRYLQEIDGLFLEVFSKMVRKTEKS